MQVSWRIPSGRNFLIHGGCMGTYGNQNDPSRLEGMTHRIRVEFPEIETAWDLSIRREQPGTGKSIHGSADTCGSGKLMVCCPNAPGRPDREPSWLAAWCRPKRCRISGLVIAALLNLTL